MLDRQEMHVQSLGGEDPLEEGMATHSSILAWRIPWTEEPGSYSPCGCKSQTQLSTHTHARTHTCTHNLGHAFFFQLEYNCFTVLC